MEDPAGSETPEEADRSRTWLNCWVCFHQGRIAIFIADLEGWIQNAREAIMLWKSFEAWAHELIWMATNSRPQIKIPYPWLRAYWEHGHGNFGKKILLSQNWGACVYTKIWKESHRDQKLPGSYHQGISCGRIRKKLIQMQNLGIGFLRIAPADNDARC